MGAEDGYPCDSDFVRFPQCGNILSIVWKNPEKVFHCVENRIQEFREASPFCIVFREKSGTMTAQIWRK